MFSTIRQFQALDGAAAPAASLNFFVKYTVNDDAVETFGGSNASMGGYEQNWQVAPGAGGNILGNPFDGGYDGGHPTSLTPPVPAP
mmetsp:Transcript_35919/g.70367  ORF Transcript_35919/g.70367 Transcript_35919/m.70367 type:complete len:86 (-) Transcript_35919:154-411(-)